MSTNRSSFIGERWQKLKILNADFELSGSGEVIAFPELHEERVRNEQARSRMDDDGCPNDGRSSSGEANGVEGKSS